MSKLFSNISIQVSLWSRVLEPEAVWQRGCLNREFRPQPWAVGPLHLVPGAGEPPGHPGHFQDLQAPDPVCADGELGFPTPGREIKTIFFESCLNKVL